MARHLEVCLTDEHHSFVESQIADGRFETSNAVVEAGLHLLERREQKRAALRAALQDGLDSGEAREFDFEELFAPDIDIVTGERRSA